MSRNSAMEKWGFEGEFALEMIHRASLSHRKMLKKSMEKLELPVAFQDYHFASPS